MTTDQYNSLTEKEKIFADLLREIIVQLTKMGADISGDIERTLGK